MGMYFYLIKLAGLMVQPSLLESFYQIMSIEIICVGDGIIIMVHKIYVITKIYC